MTKSVWHAARRLYDAGDRLIFGGKPLPVLRLSEHAPIFVSYWFDFFRNAEQIHKATKAFENPVFLFMLGYHCETDERLNQIVNEVQSVDKFVRGSRLIFMCNSPKETELLSGAGHETVFCNQNAFLDEERYPIMDCPKSYDALYLARFTPCKRHALAKSISSLLLIGSYLPAEKDHFRESLRILSHARWIERIPAAKVPAHMAKAHVGLCLSDIEGAMHVSAEYLLCGLPVVSTPNLGGRDQLFDPRWVRTTEPHPEAVAAAVQELKGKGISPHRIRQGTIAKMHEHRVRFIGLIQALYNERGIESDFSREWGGAFLHKLGLRTGIRFAHRRRVLRVK